MVLLIIEELLIFIINLAIVVSKRADHVVIILSCMSRLQHGLMLVQLILQVQACTSAGLLDLLQFSLEAFNLLILILALLLKLNLVDLEDVDFLLLFQEFLLVLGFQFVETLLNLNIAILKEVIVLFGILELLILFCQSLL